MFGEKKIMNMTKEYLDLNILTIKLTTFVMIKIF